MLKERYVVGTLVQRRDGYVFMKTETGMRAYHRVVAEQRMVNRPLKEGEIVVRIKPDRLNNKPDNLVVVQHSLTKFKKLPHTRILYVPRPVRKLAATIDPGVAKLIGTYKTRTKGLAHV